MIGDIQAQTNSPIEDIAAALAYLLQQSNPLPVQELDAAPPKRRESSRNHSRDKGDFSRDKPRKKYHSKDKDARGKKRSSDAKPSRFKEKSSKSGSFSKKKSSTKAKSASFNKSSPDKARGKKKRPAKK